MASSLKTLIIVESPAKAKTIQKYLGNNFIVRASFGHVRDLDSKKLSIDVDNGFQAKYVNLPQRKKQIDELLFILSQKPAPNVILATDEDREGEAIAWHLCQVLRLPANTPRMVFHEITPAALSYAVEHTRTIDMNLVNSQQARRMIDRLVGFKISPLLWRNIQSGLSAGRVQSVALQFIIGREKEIDEFISRNSEKSNFAVTATFRHEENNDVIQSTFSHTLAHSTDVSPLFLNCVQSVFTVGNIQNSQKSVSPSPPFTTSSLQQEVYNKYHINAKQTMSIAQKLYEGGHITYHRTDSFHISRDIQNQIIAYIQTNHGEQYVNARNYQTKSTSAQEAHECIRPTKITILQVPELAPTEQKIYQLIWKRTIASQMSAAIYDLRTIHIHGTNLSLAKKEFFIARFSKIAFDGFLRIYNVKSASADESNNEDDCPANASFPNLSLNASVRLNKLEATEKFPLPPVRYNDANFIKLLEDAEIGRPSTYATILTTIQERGYVEKKTVEGRKVPQLIFQLDNQKTNPQPQIQQLTAEYQYPGDNNRFFSTEVGRLVHQFIQEHCQTIIHPEFTKNMEKQLDDVTNGAVSWLRIMEDFYPQLLAVYQSAATPAPVVAPAKGAVTPDSQALKAPKGAVTPPSEALKAPKGAVTFAPVPTIIPESAPVPAPAPTPASANQKIKRLVGTHPTTNKPIFVYRGKFGPVAQMGTDNPAIFAKLPASLSIANCSLSDVAPLFDYPRTIGQLEEKDIVLKKGQYGLYLQWNGSNYSIRNTPEEDLTLNTAISIIQSLPENCVRKINDSIAVYNGKYGFYIQVQQQPETSAQTTPKKTQKNKPKAKPTNISFKQYNESMTDAEIMEYANNPPAPTKKYVCYSNPVVKQ